MANKEQVPEIDPALMGILALLAAERAERNPDPAVSTELVLDEAGLLHGHIAAIVGKKPDAVRMKIARAKSASKKARGRAKGDPTQ